MKKTMYLAGLYLNAVSFEDAVLSGNVKIDANSDGVNAIFELFDTFKPAKNYVVPPLED